MGTRDLHFGTSIDNRISCLVDFPWIILLSILITYKWERERFALGPARLLGVVTMK